MKHTVEKTEKSGPKKLKNPELIAFCSEMSLYLRAGNPVPECFYIFLKQEKHYMPKASVVELYSETEMGTSLYEAMGLTGIFPDHLLAMVDAGERTGHLEEVFKNLSEYYDRLDRTQRSLQSAVLYPAILLAVTIVVVLVIMPEVLPIYNDAFSALGDMLWLIPGHCDPTVNLHDFLIGVRGGLATGTVERIIRVDARGALS